MNKTNTVTAGTVCNPELFQFPLVKKRTLEAGFTGGDVSSDGGPAHARLRRPDRRIALTKALVPQLRAGEFALDRRGA